MRSCEECGHAQHEHDADGCTVVEWDLDGRQLPQCGCKRTYQVSSGDK